MPNLFLFYFPLSNESGVYFLPHLPVMDYILDWKLSEERVVIYDMPLRVNTTLMTTKPNPIVDFP